MGDDDDIAMGVLLVEPPRHAGHTFRHFDEGLTGKWEILRML
jgi:hypothetical protein